MSFIARIFGISGFISSLVAAPAAWACSCVQSTPDEFVSGIGILFEGTMVRTERVTLDNENCKDGVGPWCHETVQGVFIVHKVYKGDLGTEVRVEYGEEAGSSCGMSFQPNVRLTIAAGGDAERGYGTGFCTQVPLYNEKGRARILEAADRYRQRLELLDSAIAKSPSR